MKIGIISDIHSNIQALKAVLNEFDKINVDKIICCGDIIGIGINPEETVQELLNRKEQLIAVRGNHEEYLLKGLPKVVHNDKRKMNEEEIENHEWNHGQLSESSKLFLNELNLFETLNVENKKIFVVHYPLKNDGTYQKYIKNPSIIENKEMFKKNNADIFLFGHTHTACFNNADDKWYINTGTLGCPMNTNIARAGILEINKKNVKFKTVNVEYNVKEVVKEINNLKLPFYNNILKIFYGI